MNEMNNQTVSQQNEIESEEPTQNKMQEDGSDLQADDITIAAVANEQTVKKEKKHVNKRIVLVIIPVAFMIIVLIVFLAVRGIYNSRADAVIALINNESPMDSAKISEAYDAMGDMGKKLFSAQVKNSFISKVKYNSYYSAPYGYLVDDDKIADYRQYKKVVEVLNITPEYSNVAEYIDKVISLSVYSEYNNVYNMYYNTYSLVMSADDTVKSALKYRGNLTKERLFGDAYDTMDEAYQIALNIWDGDSRGKDYVDALADIGLFYQYVSYNFNNYYTSTLFSKDHDAGVDVFNGYVDTFKEAMEKISDIEMSLPEIEIYND